MSEVGPVEVFAETLASGKANREWMGWRVCVCVCVHEVPCSLSSLRGLINQSSRWPSQCTDGAAVIIRDRFIFHGNVRSQAVLHNCSQLYGFKS